MNWKARAIVTQELTDGKLMGIITRGKPVSYAEAVRLVGMVLRARGDAPEGDNRKEEAKPVERKSEKAEPVEIQRKRAAQKAKAKPSEYVSSEDMKTPWSEVMEAAKTDDRLETAVKEGVITPVKAV